MSLTYPGHPPKKNTMFRLDPILYAQAKEVCAQESLATGRRVTVTSVVEGALRRKVARAARNRKEAS